MTRASLRVQDVGAEPTLCGQTGWAHRAAHAPGEARDVEADAERSPTLRRRQGDLGASALLLDPATTKNDEGRFVSVTRERVELLRAQEDRVQRLELTTGRKIPPLFP